MLIILQNCDFSFPRLRTVLLGGPHEFYRKHLYTVQLTLSPRCAGSSPEASKFWHPPPWKYTCSRRGCFVKFSQYYIVLRRDRTTRCRKLMMLPSIGVWTSLPGAPSNTENIIENVFWRLQLCVPSHVGLTERLREALLNDESKWGTKGEI